MEEHYIIQGQNKLSGEVKISGSKNASLPIIAACILTDKEVVLKNVPCLKDVEIIFQVLEKLGAKVKREKNALIINCSSINNFVTPFELMNKMRASIYVMGPLLAKYGQAKVALPGGCAIGLRPINYHLNALKQMGVEFTIAHGFEDAKCEKLKGSKIYLDFPSVGATANIMMAATLAEGTTVIENCAEEPHIQDLANFLNVLGAKVYGAGAKTITVEGIAKFANGAEYILIPDQIETGTFMVAAAVTEGDVTIKNIKIEDLGSIIGKLKETGVEIVERKKSLRLKSGKIKLKAIDITTLPYPGFPTDMQPQMMALLSLVDGVSIIKETVWENRFMHVPELIRMGADLKIEGNACIITGQKKFTGCRVNSTDLRAGASLVIAGLVAHNTTLVYGLEHIDRGYENFEKKLQTLGAEIKRVLPEPNKSEKN